MTTSLLQRLGLAPKKMRPVGQTLEWGREPVEKRERRRQFIIRLLLFAGLVGLTLLAFPHEKVQIYNVEQDDIWRDKDLVAPFDFPIYKTEEELREERRRIPLEIPPVFVERPDAEKVMRQRADSMRQKLHSIFEAYISWQKKRERGLKVEAQTDSLRYYRFREGSDIHLSPEQWTLLLDSYAAQVPGLSASSRRVRKGRSLDEVLIQTAVDLGRRFLRQRKGILNVPRDSIRTEEITVLNPRTRVERRVPLQEVYTLDEVYSLAQAQLRQRFGLHSDTTALGFEFFKKILVPSLEYDVQETYKRWEEARKKILPVRDLVKEGEVIIRQGERVDIKKKRRIESLARTLAEQRGVQLRWRIIGGQLILTIIAYFIFFLYLYLMRRCIYASDRYMILITLVLALLVAGMGIMVRLPGIPGLAVPIALSAILLTVIFDSRVGIFSVITLALIAGMIFGYDFKITFLSLFAGILASFSVRDIRNRGQILVTAFLVFVAYAIGIGGFALLRLFYAEHLGYEFILVGINALSLLLAYPLLWIFERIFDITTDLRLLELSDTNHPLLRMLSMRAPGTFNHSLMVANLAEAAADAIGANALLARVGALYHDVGKVTKPEYFVENQRPGENPHDKLTPHMSALIIASHVKEGLELGKQYGLPQAVLDFIATHHGTSRIEYFYRKALEQQKPDAPPISEADFRYPGPKPFSKETAIVMLADSVEAATRSLEKPTRRKIEALIDNIFKARIEDGQLDEAPVTLAELKKIKEAFLNVLSGAYHFRVKYPDQDKQLADAEEHLLEAEMEEHTEDSLTKEDLDVRRKRLE